MNFRLSRMHKLFFEGCRFSMKLSRCVISCKTESCVFWPLDNWNCVIDKSSLIKYCVNTSKNIEIVSIYESAQFVFSLDATETPSYFWSKWDVIIIGDAIKWDRTCEPTQFSIAAFYELYAHELWKCTNMHNFSNILLQTDRRLIEEANTGNYQKIMIFKVVKFLRDLFKRWNDWGHLVSRRNTAYAKVKYCNWEPPEIEIILTTPKSTLPNLSNDGKYCLKSEMIYRIITTCNFGRSKYQSYFTLPIKDFCQRKKHCRQFEN